MTLIGEWSDLAAYYQGDDGNAWSVSSPPCHWSNCGPIGDFLAHFPSRWRGKLFDRPVNQAGQTMS